MNFLQVGQNQVGFEEPYGDLQIETSNTYSVFISESPVMKVVHKKIKSLSLVTSPVLILGAGGTGRSSVAYEIFNENKDNPSKYFVKIVCRGLDFSEIEDKLFGISKDKDLLSCGKDHTLFIKDLEFLPLFLQIKLLSYLLDYRNKEKLPRLICSAGEKLSEMVKTGKFSRELFEIISQNLLILPSLSERPEDIPFFISLFNKQNAFTSCFTEGALQALRLHSWEGNITELKNICRQISVLCADKEFVSEEDLSVIIKNNQPTDKIIVKYNPNLSLEVLVNRYIQMSLEHFQSKKKSAKALGISVKTIYNKIKTGCVAYSD